MTEWHIRYGGRGVMIYWHVEKNYVDSHGQSEVAFAFCHLLGFDLLPRLKGICRVERRRVAGRVRWLIRCFRSRAAVRFPWARFLPPSSPGGFHPEALTEPDVSLSTYPARATH